MELKKVNQELQRHESKPLGNGERFLKAIESPKIEDCQPDDISGCLKYAMAKIGLRAANMPSQIEKAFLISHIQGAYGHLRVDEIRIAFDWALEDRLGVDINCYENFSCAYVSKILNAYWRLAKNVKVGDEFIKREGETNQLPFNGHISGLLGNAD